MKIIHIVENLNTGAVENWLVNIFLEARIKEPHIEWTFYCILGKPGRLDGIVLSNGGEIIYSPVKISNKISFLKHLRGTLIKGNYDIIHSHHDYLSGFYLLAAFNLGINRRILHVHNTDKGLPVSNCILEFFLLKLFWVITYFYNDLILCISKDVKQSFVGMDWLKKSRILYYGIKLDRFQSPVNDCLFKSENGIESNTKLLLFVGRLNNLKNPIFLIHIMNYLVSMRNDIQAIIIGEGEQKKDILEAIKKFNLEEKIHLLGWRDNIHEWMMVSDLFIFPRKEYPKEGLGIVMLESQACGLRSLITNGIVKDVLISKHLNNILPLKDGAEKWAQKVVDLIDLPKENKQSAFALVKKSNFNLPIGLKKLVNYYE